MRHRHLALIFLIITAICIPSPSAAREETGLIAYYPLDINVKNRFNQPESAQYFDGLYEFTIINLERGISGKNFSVSFWIKPSKNNKKLQYFIKCRAFGVWQLKEKLGFTVSHQETGSTAGTIPSFDQWIHFLGTFDGFHIRIYINGNLTDTAALAGTIVNSNRKLTLGYSQLSYWQGTLDDVRIYNRVLTSSEITDLSDPINSIQIGLGSLQTNDRKPRITQD